MAQYYNVPVPVVLPQPVYVFPNKHHIPTVDEDKVLVQSRLFRCQINDVHDRREMAQYYNVPVPVVLPQPVYVFPNKHHIPTVDEDKVLVQSRLFRCQINDVHDRREMAQYYNVPVPVVLPQPVYVFTNKHHIPTVDEDEVLVQSRRFRCQINDVHDRREMAQYYNVPVPVVLLQPIYVFTNKHHIPTVDKDKVLVQSRLFRCQINDVHDRREMAQYYNVPVPVVLPQPVYVFTNKHHIPTVDEDKVFVPSRRFRCQINDVHDRREMAQYYNVPVPVVLPQPVYVFTNKHHIPTVDEDEVLVQSRRFRCQINDVHDRREMAQYYNVPVPVVLLQPIYVFTNKHHIPTVDEDKVLVQSRLFRCQINDVHDRREMAQYYNVPVPVVLPQPVYVFTNKHHIPTVDEDKVFVPSRRFRCQINDVHDRREMAQYYNVPVPVVLPQPVYVFTNKHHIPTVDEDKVLVQSRRFRCQINDVQDRREMAQYYNVPVPVVLLQPVYVFTNKHHIPRVDKDKVFVPSRRFRCQINDVHDRREMAQYYNVPVPVVLPQPVYVFTNKHHIPTVDEDKELFRVGGFGVRSMMFMTGGRWLSITMFQCLWFYHSLYMCFPTNIIYQR